MVPKVVVWLVWASMFSVLFLYRLFLGSDRDQETDTGAFMWTMLFLPALLCLVLRWIILPKAKDISAIIPIVIIGLFAGESISFFGYILFPGYQDLFFAVSVVMVAQFAPTYLLRKRVQPPDLKNTNSL